MNPLYRHHCALERGAQPQRRQPCRGIDRPRADKQHRPAECTRDRTGRVGAHDRHDRVAGGRDYGAEPPGYLLGDRCERRYVDELARCLSAIRSDAADQARRHAVRTLERPVGQRQPRLVEEHDRTEAAQRSSCVAASHHVLAADLAPRQQCRGQPRRRELPREVVVEITIEPGVPPAQLGRSANREDRALERVESQQLRQFVKARVG